MHRTLNSDLHWDSTAAISQVVSRVYKLVSYFSLEQNAKVWYDATAISN